MSNLTPIMQAVDFVEGHLKDAISVADIAAAASYSVYHFCRVFNRYTHHSPFDYLMRRRLAESARDLVHTERRIIDVALDYQFGSPEAFSRAFKRMFAFQPRQWRQRGKMEARSAMTPLTLAHLEYRSRDGGVRPLLVHRSALQVAGVVTLVGGERSSLAGLWDLLSHELQRAGLDGPSSYYGVASYPADWQKSGFFYMAGVEAGALRNHASSLVSKTIPSSEFASFKLEGTHSDAQYALDYGYQTWLPRSGRTLVYPLEIESFGGTLPGSDNKSLHFEILLPVA